MQKKELLIDLDGVVADLDKEIMLRIHRRFPELLVYPGGNAPSYFLEDLYPTVYHAQIVEMFLVEGLFLQLEVIPGAREALKYLVQQGHDVRLCSAPTYSFSRYCASEKAAWVHHNLGAEWEKRLILTHDKTVVDGDILVDDRPSVTGVRQPRWEHVLYDRLCNRSVPGLRRINWKNFRHVLCA